MSNVCARQQVRSQAKQMVIIIAAHSITHHRHNYDGSLIFALTQPLWTGASLLTVHVSSRNDAYVFLCRCGPPLCCSMLQFFSGCVPHSYAQMGNAYTIARGPLVIIASWCAWCDRRIMRCGNRECIIRASSATCVDRRGVWGKRRRRRRRF